MDLSSIQHSPSIFNSDATICPRKKAENVTIGQGSRRANWHSNSADLPIILAILVLPIFVILILFYSNFAFLTIPPQ